MRSASHKPFVMRRLRRRITAFSIVLLAGTAWADTSPPTASVLAPLMAPQIRYGDVPAETASGSVTDAARTPSTVSDQSDCIKRDQNGRFVGWMDYQHCVFSGRTLATAVWFDDLFGDWHDNEATLLLRAITEVTTVQGEGNAVRFRLRASAALPNASQRLRLVVTDDSDADENVTGQDVRSQLSAARDNISAALRWVPFERAGFKSDFDLGVRGLGPPDFFARMRVRKSWSVTEDSVLRLGETLRYGSESRGRAITQLDYEYALAATTLARVSSAVEFREVDRDQGLFFAHGISLSHALGQYRSLGYGYSFNGHTRPELEQDSRGPWILYRSNWLRPWLFFEVEPRLTWYEELYQDSVWSLTLRLELHLGKK